MKKAIITLCRGYDDNYQYSNLIIRNKFIEENINDKCEIIIFHEGNITLENQKHIRSKTSLCLNFISIPKFVEISDIEFDNNKESIGFDWAYRHMCHFWFIGFLKYLDAYDLVLRIDDDCLIRSTVDDIFKILENKVCVYGEWSSDYESVTKGLNDFTLNNIDTDKGSKTPSGPYTNVVGFNLNKIRENIKVKQYMDKVDKSNNIFIYRWGDLPLWGEVLHYLFDKQDSLYLPIKYYHGSHNNFINY